MRGPKGFTLIELLVVISVIGLLASVILISLNSARAKARDAKRIADLRQTASALELYFDANNQFPPDVVPCDTSRGGSVNCTPGTNGVPSGWDGGGFYSIYPTFTSSLPKDPENLNNPNFYYYEPVQGETQFGVTCAVGNACAYIFSARLEGSSPNPGCNACLGSHNYCISGGGAQPGASC
ncbi:MAG: hypothetical protein A2751_04960 [Candidatus Doudnabacteria bacterium RIFCSPHIGHO2_01_FULL_46_14]|uniref:Type II secretion system protein GspG C-terminal domain-containing protein n=1 Tax=Candidatus Doudnabacteria bacterium RIFCSPHIGHO2_01_FULL_46_14 TaxID=1817824 RepID=A0A1F5NP16_9BACT|nr:MAG: hypothetical protein A2751_04960 [Candidatus Doudnabacteria bacterium RIFCSPHIGHO2_01_FULL_46_14]